MRGRANEVWFRSYEGPRGTTPRDGTAEVPRGGAIATARWTTANTTEAEAAVAASGAGARWEPPPESGAAWGDDGIACPRQGGEI